MNIIPEGGLCNRLRVLFSHLQIAKQNNKTLNVYWKINSACNGSFLDVFSHIETIYFIDKPPEIIDYRGGSSCVKLNKQDYLELIPNEIIQSKIIQLSKNEFDAIHIRRTDHVELATQKQKFMPNFIFENFINESDKKVFLACDDKDTRKYFLTKYPNKIFVNDITYNSNNQRQTSLEDAVVDLFVCVKSKNFLGTEYSSYSDLIKLLRN